MLKVFGTPRKLAKRKVWKMDEAFGKVSREAVKNRSAVLPHGGVARRQGGNLDKFGKNLRR